MDRLIVSLCLLVVLSGCGKKQEKQSVEKKVEEQVEVIGKYLYIDAAGTAHIKRDCFWLKFGNMNDEISHAVKYVLLDTIEYHDFFCDECVTEKTFEKIDSIMRWNRKRIIEY